MTLGKLCDTSRMRRVGLAVAVAFGLIFSGASAVTAAPNPSPSTTGPAIPVAAAQAPTKVCTIPSSADYLTGIVATKSGYVVVNEAGGRSRNITYLNSDCSRDKTKSYSGSGSRDPEDIAIDKSGTMWVADIGDPAPTNRSNIALWKVSTGGTVTLYRFTYPDGPHPAKAMVLDGDGRPIFITQPTSGSGPAGLYEPPAGALTENKTPVLVKVGTFAPEDTGTDNKLEAPGRLLVTGGANSPDGTKVVLRTYSDAYEWTVSGGNVVAAITKSKPTITAMPDEAQGEAIAFTSNGSDFLTVSNVNTSTPLFKYTPAAPVAAAKKASALAGPKKRSALRSFFDNLSLRELQLLLAGVAVFGLALVIIGIMGIRRSRQRHRDAVAAGELPLDGRGQGDRQPVGAASAGGVYGAPGGPAPQSGRGGPYGPPGAVGPPGVYGGPPSGPGRGGPGPGGPGQGSPGPGGNVYGGGGAGGGGVYGSPNQPARGGNVYGAPGAPATPAGAGVYGAPRDDRRGYDPYADEKPASGRYGGDPYSDPYAAPPRPAGGPSSGAPTGGQYGTPVDPYQQPPRPPADDRRRPPAYPPEDYDDYGR